MRKIYTLFLLLFFFPTCSIKAQVNLNDSLVAYYPFDGNAQDSSGNGYNGTIDGAVLTTDRFGKPNSAYSFVYGENISLGNVWNNVFAGTGKKFSYSVWVKPSAYNPNNMIIAKHSDGGCYPAQPIQEQHFLRLFNGVVEFEYFSSNGANGRFIGGSTSITDTSKWYHIVMTYDGTINTNYGLDRVKIYVNGISDLTSFARTGIGSVPDLEVTDTYVGIGEYLTSTGVPCDSLLTFSGKIDDIHVYSRLLDACEVYALYEPINDSLVAYYPFDGNAQDSSGNGYNGTIDGAVLTTDRFGNPNSAFSFQKGENISLGNVLNNVFAGVGKRFSYSVWVKPSAYNSNNMIIAKHSDGGCALTQPIPQFQHFLRLLNGITEFEYFSSDGANGRFVGGSTSITDTSKWYHIVMIYDGTINTNDGLDRVTLYVNDIPEATSFARTSVGSLPDMEVTDTYVGIGEYLTSTGVPCDSLLTFNGKIDDIHVYSRLLSSCNVHELYSIKESNDSSGITSVQTASSPSVNSLNVYPNPAKETLTIVSSNLSSYTYTLTNMQGTIILSGAGGSTIQLPQLTKGIYILKLESAQNIEYQKIVIE